MTMWVGMVCKSKSRGLINLRIQSNAIGIISLERQ